MKRSEITAKLIELALSDLDFDDAYRELRKEPYKVVNPANVKSDDWRTMLKKEFDDFRQFPLKRKTAVLADLEAELVAEIGEAMLKLEPPTWGDTRDVVRDLEFLQKQPHAKIHSCLDTLEAYGVEVNELRKRANDLEIKEAPKPKTVPV